MWWARNSASRSRSEPLALVAWLALSSCAQFSVERETEVVQAGPPVVLGPPRDSISQRNYAVRWLQMGDSLVVQIRERRACREVLHTPVTRIERVRKLPDGAVFWELGLGLATGAFAAVAFAQPEAFGPRLLAEDGRQVFDSSAGTRIGAVFVGISALNFIALAVDLAKIRNYAAYTPAYREELGGERTCNDPEGPLRSTPVTLVIGALEIEASTDDSGRARFVLPSDFTPGAAAIKVDDAHAIGIRLAAPGAEPSGGETPFDEEPP